MRVYVYVQPNRVPWNNGKKWVGLNFIETILPNAIFCIRAEKPN